MVRNNLMNKSTIKSESNLKRRVIRVKQLKPTQLLQPPLSNKKMDYIKLRRRLFTNTHLVRDIPRNAKLSLLSKISRKAPTTKQRIQTIKRKLIPKKQALSVNNKKPRPTLPRR